MHVPPPVDGVASLPAQRRLNAGAGDARRRPLLPWLELGLLVLFAAVPLFADTFWIAFCTRVAILGILALSFDLAWGYAGILSFGQALFFGVAGYAVALIETRTGVTSAAVLLPVAMGVGLVLALLMAALVLFGRRPPTQVFVALGTLTGSYVVDRVARGWTFVGGQNGIPSIPPATFAGQALLEGPAFYYTALVLLVAVYLGLRWLVRSQFGLVLSGIRQQEERVGFLGYNAQNYKGVVFCISGAVAGLSGALYALHEGFIGPGQIGPTLSTQVVLYAMFGGVGTLVGAVVGTGLVEFIGFFASQYFENGWPIVLALLLLLVVTVKPSGLIGMLIPERERQGRFGVPPRREEP